MQERRHREKAKLPAGVPNSYHHLRRLGVTVHYCQQKLAEQGYVCAICRHPERKIDKRTGKAYALSLDHHHATNTPRGILCYICNQLLGVVESGHIPLNRFKDASYAQAIRDYLLRYGGDYREAWPWIVGTCSNLAGWT